MDTNQEKEKKRKNQKMKNYPELRNREGNSFLRGGGFFF